MVTETGYRRRTYEEILNAKIQKARELFGEDINTEGNTPLGKFIRINAYDQYNVEEIAEKIYYSIFPQTSNGATLDRHARNIGITRNIATPSQYSVQVTGMKGQTVEYGFLVGTETGLTFYNTKNTEIGENGVCIITVECTTTGVIGNVPASTISRVIQPVAHIDTVIGIELLESGEEEESDYEFLKRYEVVRDGKGSCNEASILSAITSIPSVQDAYVTVNESATETVDGVPPKTIACYVDGGENHSQEIAEAIFDKKPIGIGTHGTETVYVSYGSLSKYAVKFSYSQPVGVYVSLELITNDNFEASGNGTIKTNIANYIKGLGLGVPLVVTALYSQIYTVAGVVSATVTAATDGEDYSASKIEIAPYEILQLKKLTINGVEV